jgi:hypothetical protein
VPTLITVGTGTLSCASLALNPIAANLGSNNRRVEVTISSGTLTVSGNISASGDIVTNGGGTGITLTGAGTVNVGGSFYTSPNIGEFTPGTTSTINYNGAAQTILPATYATLEISGSGTKTLSGAASFTALDLTAGTLAAGNNLSIATTGTPLITRAAGDMTGNLQTTRDYDVTYTGLTKTAGPELAASGLRNVIVNVGATETVTLNANRAPDGSLTVTAGTLDLSTFTINRSTNGGTLTISDGATLKIGGTNAFPTGYTTHSVGNVSATVEYAGTNQTVSALAGAEVYTNLTLSGSGTKTFATETVNGVLSIQGTAVTAGVSPTYGANAILEYKGSGQQTTSNVEFVGTGANPANLRIDNTNGVILNAGKTLNGALTLTNGYLTTTGTTLLALSTTGTASTSNGAFVNGPMTKNTATNGANFVFPVGTLTGGLRTIGITTNSANSTVWRASFTSSSPKQAYGTTFGSGIQQISACEYWDLTRSSGTAGGRVTLSWPAAANSCGTGAYVTNIGTLVVAHLSGGSWLNEGQQIGSMTGTASGGGTITSNNVLTTFSPFALGTTNAADNPLPVMFADVKAFQKNGSVQIDWTNLTERDLIKYEVERSADGRSFTAFSFENARANNNDKQSYSVDDIAPLNGANFYRVKAYEIGGKMIYSKVLKVEIGGKQGAFSIYPNPVVGNQLSLSLSVKQGQYTVRVLNTSGQEVFNQRLNHPGGALTQTISLPSSVKPGVYNITVNGDNYRQAKMFVVQ